MITSPIANRPRTWKESGRRALCWLEAFALLVVPLLASPGPLAAQPGELEGRTIEAIEFEGMKTLTEETLLYYLALEPGQTLSRAKLDQSIQQLWGRNLVDDVEVEAFPTDGGGVRLLIRIAERPVLRSIEYEGLKRISRTDILDKIGSQRIRVREGEPLSLGELQRVKALIEEMYAEKGYRLAQADYEVEDVGTNEKRVVFRVDEGDRVRIAEIAFEGNEVFGDARLEWTMKKTSETGPISRILKKDIYNPATFQEDLDKVRDIYRGAGYKNVVIGEPQIEVRATNPDAPAEQQKRRMFITVPIEEGERWRFGEVTVEGNEIYSDQMLLKAFQNRPGSWLRAKLVDEAVKSVDELYKNTGYIFARVQPELVERPGNVADVILHVAEGEQFRVGRIEFEGNTRTMDKVLRRELRVQEGTVMNVGGVRNSIFKINQLGYFKLDEEEPVDFDPVTEEKRVNLVFKGEEAERTELQFGGGWSEVDDFFGQFAINTKNFLGRGEQLGLSLQTGRFRDFFDLSYYVPWFLDRPQSIGLRAFDQELDYSPFSDQRLIQKSQGGVLTYGRNLGLFQSLSASYNRSVYEQSGLIFDPTTGEPTEINLQDIDNSSVRPAYIYDSRDNPFEPTRGRRLAASVEYAGGFLGGDNYFLRPELSFSFFQPISNYPTRTVFAFNVEAGYINGFGDGQLSIFELYRLGGENSVRGFPFRSISLRKPDGTPATDPTTGFVLGGTSFAQFNVEYHFLLGGPFRILGFVDAGNVYGEDKTFDLSDLRYTAGLELRVLVPVFGAPLRFIYSNNLDPLPGERFDEFQFSIGTSF